MSFERSPGGESAPKQHESAATESAVGAARCRR